jgi:RNA polymerase sigma factor (sigma-70 family)
MRRGTVLDPPAAKDESATAGAPSLARLAYAHFGMGLQRFLMRRLRSRENAEDLAQEVYLRLLRFADAELVQRPEAYVYQVAFNVFCEFRLAERRNVVTFDSNTAAQLEEDLAADLVSPDEAIDQQAWQDRLDAVIEGLPAMQRAVFLLAVRHGLPHSQIAQKLEISMHTVRKYLYKALHYCRQHLPEA